MGLFAERHGGGLRGGQTFHRTQQPVAAQEHRLRIVRSACQETRLRLFHGGYTHLPQSQRNYQAMWNAGDKLQAARSSPTSPATLSLIISFSSFVLPLSLFSVSSASTYLSRSCRCYYLVSSVIVFEFVSR